MNTNIYPSARTFYLQKAHFREANQFGNPWSKNTIKTPVIPVESQFQSHKTQNINKLNE